MIFGFIHGTARATPNSNSEKVGDREEGRKASHKSGIAFSVLSSVSYKLCFAPRVQTKGLDTHLCRGNFISGLGVGSWFKQPLASAPILAMELLPHTGASKPSVWARGENWRFGHEESER